MQRKVLSPCPRHQGECAPWRALHLHLEPQGDCPPKPVEPEAAGELGWRLAKYQSGVEKSETKPLSACCRQKDQQNWLTQFEARRQFLFLSNFLFFIIIIICLLTASSSFLLSGFIPSFLLSFPLYLFFLPTSFFSFFKSHK